MWSSGGHSPGFFSAWRGRGNAYEATQGFSGALHKRCPSHAAAVRYWRSHTSDPVPRRPSDPVVLPEHFPDTTIVDAVLVPPGPSSSAPPVTTSASPTLDLESNSDFGYISDRDSLTPPAYLVVRSSASRNNRELRGIHYIPGDDPTWTQAVTFLGAGGLEFAFLSDLPAAHAFLGDSSALPIVENSPLTPPLDSTAHRTLWPMFNPTTTAVSRTIDPTPVVASIPSLRTITSVVARLDLDISSVDIREAFLAVSTAQDDKDWRVSQHGTSDDSHSDGSDYYN